jgi:hypothetical protein
MGARFFARIQASPGAHTASYTKGTGSFVGVKRPGHGAGHHHPHIADVENEYSFPSRPLVDCYRVTFTLPMCIKFYNMMD